MENQSESRIFSVFPDDNKQRYMTSNTKYRDYVLILPQEIAVKIFSFLSIPELRTCAVVSKYWNLLSSSTILWLKISLKGISIKIHFLERILNSNVREILFHRVKIIEAESLVPPFFKNSRFDSLHTISFRGFIRPEMLDELLHLSPNLRFLELRFLHADLGSSFFRQIVKLRFLEKLDLYYLRIKDVSEIIEIIQSAEKFETLKNILFWTRFDDKRQSEQFYENFLGQCPNMEILAIPEQHINESAFKYILKMKHLKKLNIRKTILPSNLSHMENPIKWINLQAINIYGTDNPASVITLLLLSPNLEDLSVGGVITYSIFEQILAYKNLKKLRFINFDLTILNNVKSFKKFNELRVLELFNYNLSGLPELEASILNILFYRCEKLTELFICEPVIDEILFRQILEMDNLEKLEVVGPKFPSKFNSDGNLGEYRNFRRLKYLFLELRKSEHNFSNTEIILSCCKNLTDLTVNVTSERIWNYIFSMSELKKLCLFNLKPDETNLFLYNIDTLPKLLKLKSLSISYWKLYPNLHQIEAFLSFCVNLESLSMFEVNLTDSICRSIAAMKDLKNLHLEFVCGISDDKIQFILNRCSRLTRDKIKIVTSLKEAYACYNIY